MKRRPIILFLAVPLALVVLMPGTGFAANLFANADNGISERIFASNSKAGTDEIAFVWEPELPRHNTMYAVGGLCNREDEFGEFLGNHKVIFKNISLTGIDSGNELLLARQTRRLRGGLQNDFALWDITPEVADLFSGDDFILVHGRITVRKRVAAGNLLTCGLFAAEVDMTGLQANSAVVRLRQVRQAAVRLLPRLQVP